MALASLGKAAASAVLVGAMKDTILGRARLSDVAEKLPRRNPPGKSGILFSALVERVEERPFQGLRKA
jgi:hypothetical protein